MERLIKATRLYLLSLLIFFVFGARCVLGACALLHSLLNKLVYKERIKTTVYGCSLLMQIIWMSPKAGLLLLLMVIRVIVKLGWKFSSFIRPGKRIEIFSQNMFVLFWNNRVFI